MRVIGFDIETAPLPMHVIKQRVKPFRDTPYQWRSDWKEETNLAKKEKHDEGATEREKDYYNSKIEKAALSAATGRVLCYSWYEESGSVVKFAHESEHEKYMLQGFWKNVSDAMQMACVFVGFNIHKFDLPFLVNRSRMLGVKLPPFLKVNSNRYWNNAFVDLVSYWEPWTPIPAISLDVMANCFGVDGKADNGVTGANFAEKIKEDLAAATEYAEQDARICFDLWGAIHND